MTSFLRHLLEEELHREELPVALDGQRDRVPDARSEDHAVGLVAVPHGGPVHLADDVSDLDARLVRGAAPLDDRDVEAVPIGGAEALGDVWGDLPGADPDPDVP